jgi:hypothetical protein
MNQKMTAAFLIKGGEVMSREALDTASHSTNCPMNKAGNDQFIN